jgi:hypothetical protein
MINWTALAKKFGYDDPCTMLRDLYWNKGLSVQDVADKLCLANGSVTKQMALCLIPRRKRIQVTGGPPCPSCGHHRTRIVLSERKKEKYVRTRICLKCSMKFKTKEEVWND